MAVLLVDTGVPRMAARVFATLCIKDSGSGTAAELARELRVSPASISAAVATLEGFGLIRRERPPGTRRELYVIGDDAWYRATVASIRSNDILAAAAQHGATLLGPTSPAGARLRTASRFLDNLGRDLERAAENWRRLLVDPPGRPESEMD
nr:MarR family transcriptional regulator [Nocardia transvalensis]